MNPSTTPAHTFLGIDVAKAKLDCCLLLPQGHAHKAFANTPAGWSKLRDWAMDLSQGKPCHFALEVTASYSEGIATFLAQDGQRVSLLHPARVRFAALAAGSGNKTDKADARVIAHYCRQQNPPLWQPPSPELRTLADLVRRREDLLEMLQQEKNRQEQQCLDKAVRQSLQRCIRALEREMARLEKAIVQHVQSHPQLASQAALLESIPGISTLTAHKILAELGGDAKRFASSSAAAAYAGLAPCEHRSGTSVRRKTQLSKRGNPRLRKALYFPTVTALSHNPLIKTFYERLVASGKRKMVALAAAMRKLLMIALGVLRSGQPFDASRAQQVQQQRAKALPAAP